ncbi:TPA: hypothetical protein EYN65_19195, partial [Candidatus Poribacteria bacterium]|nr:hypothetical protein [Candidatus Poribacteria bacterium]
MTNNSKWCPVAIFQLLICGMVFEVSAITVSHLKTSNVSATSVVISWVTDQKPESVVNYGLTKALGQTAHDSRKAFTHWVEITGLTEDTDYYFEVISGTTTDNNDGEYYTFRSAQFGIGVPYTLYGQLTDGESASAVAEAIVEVSLLRSQSVSSHLTVLTDENGFWYVNLGNL